MCTTDLYIIVAAAKVENGSMNLHRQVEGVEEGEVEEDGTLNVAKVLGASLSARAKPKRQRAASNTPGPVARVRVRARAGPERPFKNLLSHQARPLLNAVRRRHPDASRKW